jgi:mRNA interferase RelE/StbE
VTERRYEIKLDPYARKALGAIDTPIRRRIVARIDELAAEPRPPGAIMLKGRHGDWRIRVGDWRVIYTIDDSVLLVLVIEVNHRREVYRR